jgi:hypothetical protein
VGERVEESGGAAAQGRGRGAARDLRVGAVGAVDRLAGHLGCGGKHAGSFLDESFQSYRAAPYMKRFIIGR